MTRTSEAQFDGMAVSAAKAAPPAERTIRRTPGGHRSPSAEVDL
jgi:hypothetical protein